MNRSYSKLLKAVYIRFLSSVNIGKDLIEWNSIESI